MCFLFHKWGKWEDVASGKMLYPRSEYMPPGKVGGVAGYYVRQERRCSVCGKLQLRVAST